MRKFREKMKIMQNQITKILRKIQNLSKQMQNSREKVAKIHQKRLNPGLIDGFTQNINIDLRTS